MKKKNTGSPYAERYPNALRAALAKDGRSITQLAADLNMDRPYLSRMISGHYVPLVTTAMALAHALGVTVEKLWSHLDFEEVRRSR